MASAGLGSAYRQLRALFGGGSVVALEDGQLLARFATDRDEAAFEALIARHGPMVLTVCRAVLRNEHDVEDAFQATFLVLARKAGSIRGGDALGGWLHRVAYRASVQAGVEATRRRRKEAEAQAMAAQISRSSEPDRDLQALLHEEIDRLPGSERLPIVLCDLEGLTYEQAASQLRWSVPKLRNRLARGRQKLKSRLTRRGLMAGAITSLMASKASAAVPLGLARITLSGATGGAGSTTAAVLAQTLVKGMLMTKLKIASTVGIAALTLAGVGLIAAGSGKTRDEPKPVPKPAPRPEVVVQEQQKPGEPVEVQGIVVDPAGKPVAGATIRGDVVWPDPAPEAKSGPDGRYTIKLAPLRSNLPTEFQWGSRTLIASAPGFGMQVVWFNARPARPADVTIQLVEEGPAIEGRLLDIEGKPVAGARVQVESVWGPIRGTIEAWLADLKNPQPNVGPWLGLRGVATPFEVATGADGRFVVSGIGRDRVVILQVSGPKIATTTVHAVTQEMKGTHKVVQAGQPPYFTCYGPKFDLSIPPGRVIEGVIRDKDTGKPIEGLRVGASANGFAEALEAAGREGARTDAQGRYRLTGVGVSKTYTIFVQPTLGLPYLTTKLGLAESPLTTEPIEYDFKLRRGVVVRGRITDKVTGLPVPGRVTAFTYVDNPAPVNADGFLDYSGYTACPTPSSHNRPDGTYEVVTVPGRGIIGFLADKAAYRVAVGGEKIAGFDPTFKKVFRTWPQPCSPGDYHVLAEVNLDPKADSATLDLQADPGRSLKIHVIDPDLHPIDGLTAEGTTDLGRNQPVEVKGSIVEVSGLDPSRPRRVTVFHQGRKLVGSIWLKGDEVDSPEVWRAVQLQPWGTIVGRVIDDQGEPLSRDVMSGNINMAITKPEEYGTFPGGVVGTGVPGQKDGRFRIEGLVPGLKYAGCTVNGQLKGRVMGDLFQDVTVTPGEVKDLGDLKVLPWKP